MKRVMFLYQTNKARGSELGGGATPYNGLYGEVSPERGTVFTRISAYNASSAALLWGWLEN